MLVEVIKRPYRKYKVGDQFEIKAKDARILILLKRVKEVPASEPKEQAPKESKKIQAPEVEGLNSKQTSDGLSDQKPKGNKSGTRKPRASKKQQAEEQPE